MLPKLFKEMEAKQSKVIHHDQVTQPLFNQSITGAQALTIEHFIFFIMAVLIVEMLFSVCNLV